MKKKNLFLLSLLVVMLSACNQTKQETQSPKSLMETADVPYLYGESREVIAANPDPANNKEKWFINDHCFVVDHKGTLHWFGINNPFPPKGKELYRYHPFLGHLTTEGRPDSTWTRQPFALNVLETTEYVGAPSVIWLEESKRWVMVVETWKKQRHLETYFSDDLYTWTSSNQAILPDDLWIGTRDPQIMKGTDGKYWLHVVSTGIEGVKQSQVLRIKTKDFIHFDKPKSIMNIDNCKWATLIESPSLCRHNNLWYLFFTYAHRRYTETCVVVSDNPDSFDYDNNTIATLFGHAAKILDYKGETFITSCGPEDDHYLSGHGLTMAHLKWAKQ